LRLHTQERLPPAKANIEALIRIEAWLRASVKTHQTVGVETVLSTDKYRSLVLDAKTLGFEVRLLYVILRGVELNVERVRIRVAAGGHNVPEHKIRERRQRSLRQLPWFLNQADYALIFDNSGARAIEIGRKTDDQIIIDPSAPDEIKIAVETIRNLAAH
jgi:predicted ABC-type ATPase